LSSHHDDNNDKPHANAAGRLHILSPGIIILVAISSLILIPTSFNQSYIPVYAGNKITNSDGGGNIQAEVRIQRLETSSYFEEPITVCGLSDTFNLVILLRNYHYVLFEDNSYRITSATRVQFFDSSGLLAASSPQSQIITDGTTSQFNVVINCMNNGENGHDGQNNRDNQDLNYHFGYTLDQDGVIKEIHLVYK
jgi:hypothetical protein